jgi:type VI protein secretion system component VasK
MKAYRSLVLYSCWLLVIQVSLAIGIYREFARHRLPGSGDGWRGIYEQSPVIWISLGTLIITSIATLSSTILAWKNERRNAKESELKIEESKLKIEQLERELKAAQTKSPKTLATKRRKKALKS